MRDGERGERQQCRCSVTEHGLDLGELPAEHGCDRLELLVDILGVGVGRRSFGSRRPPSRPSLWDLAQDVAQEVHAAALDARPSQHRLHRLAKPQVGVGDDQVDPAQPTSFEATQEAGPECAVLAVAHAEPEGLTARPSAHTPVATTTAWLTTRRFTLALQ
jgi:hypothetical protein